MPRNITVTFDDGSKHVYQGAPDDITPDQVTSRAQQEFGKQVTGIDGGRPKQNQTNTVAPQVQTRQQRVQDIARRKVEFTRKYGAFAGTPLGDIDQALMAGFERASFGLPERARAAVTQFIGPKEDRGRTYQEQLDIEREITNQQAERSRTGNILGTLVSAGMTGGATTGAAKGVAAKLVASGAKGGTLGHLASQSGRALQEATTLRQGQKARNTLKVMAGGAAGGATQAAGEGSDTAEGALVGAAAPVVLGGALKTAQMASGGLRSITKQFSGDVSKALRDVVKESPDAIALRQSDMSRKTGENVPLIAALNDRDFRTVTDEVLRKTDDAMHLAKTKTGEYIRGFMDRMLRHVNTAGKGVSAAEGDAMIATIGDLSDLRRSRVTELMEPIRSREMDLSQIQMDDIEKKVTRQIGGRIVGLGTRIRQAIEDISPDDTDIDGQDIKNVRKLLEDWGLAPEKEPVRVTVGEMDSLRRALNAASKSSELSNPANSMAYKNAADAVNSFIKDNVPEYSRVVDTHASMSRMMEGFKTAAAGTRLEDVEKSLLRDNLRSPEGRVGMRAGELFRLREIASGKPTQAISLARDLGAEGRLTRPAALTPNAPAPGTVTTNLGGKQAARLAEAGRGETEVLGRMLDTERLNALAKQEVDTLSAEEIAYGALLANALPVTQARFAAKIMNKLPHGFNKRVAMNITEMLYSNDKQQTRKALQTLTKLGMTERTVKSLMQEALPVSIVSGQVASMDEAPGQGADMLTYAPQPIIPGNLPTEIRAEVTNPDGSVSTVRTISIGTEQGEVLIPTVINGKVVSDEDAIRHFEETGENFGTFESPEDADAYAQALHEYHAGQLQGR